MKRIFTIAFSVLFMCNAYCQTAPAHLKYYGFYLVNTGIDDPYDGVDKTNYTDEVGDFTSLNQAAVYFPTQNISADVNNMNAACTKPFMSIEQIFWQRVDGNAPSGNNYDLYPDWQARWSTFKATNAASLTANKIGCFYIVDEPLWNGIPFDELNAVTQVIKNDYPSVPTFYIEAFPMLEEMQIPTSVDWVAFDQYGIFDPATNAAYLGRLATLKSKRSNNQRVFIISDTRWVPSYGDENITPAAMGATIQSYYDLAASDPDVIGLIGFLWPGGFDGPGSLGARNLPQAVKDKLASHGRLIKANYSPCGQTPAPTTPTVPTGLVASPITKTSFTLSWTASTDDVAVTGYEVFVNGQYYGATTSTSLNIAGLTCATQYNMTVDAFDNVSPPHNVSAASDVKSVTTSDCDSPQVPTFSGVYTLEARHSGKMLDVSGAANADGAAVQQWDAWGGANQQWQLAANADGSYRLTAQHSGKVLGVAGADPNNGAAVQQQGNTGAAAQRWQVASTSDGYYKLLNQASGKSLDVAGGPGATGNGVPLQQWEYVGGTNQQWKLTQVTGTRTALANRSALASPASFSAYPNPSPDGRSMLRLTAPKAQTATVVVYDALGRTRTRLDVPVPAGSTEAALPPNLPAGLYFLQTTISGQVLRCTLRVE